MANGLEVPPHDLDAERGALGSILLDSTKLDDVTGIVVPESFFYQPHQQVFAAMLSLHREGIGLDPVTIHDRLEKSGADKTETADAMVSCMNSVPHAVHAVHYAQQVADKYARRRLLYEVSECAKESRDPLSDIDEILSRTEGALHSIVESRTAREVTDFTTTLIDLQDLIESGSTHGLNTGFYDLDDMTHGLQPGNLIILAARPSMGKTAFCGNLFYNVAKSGQAVLFVSLEQSRLEIAERMLSMLTGYSSVHLRNKDKYELDFGLICNSAAALSNLPMHLDDTPGQTISQIAARARIHRRKYGIKLLIIDYLQLISPEDKRIPREQQVATITRSLKLLARSLEIPIIALAQLNRQIESRSEKKPVLSDLRESGAIEQDADLVWFLHRPFVYDETADESLAELIVAKLRNGRCGTVKLQWDGKTTSFQNAAIGKWENAQF